jgi:hypothetical protein
MTMLFLFILCRNSLFGREYGFSNSYPALEPQLRGTGTDLR